MCIKVICWDESSFSIFFTSELRVLHAQREQCSAFTLQWGNLVALYTVKVHVTLVLNIVSHVSCKASGLFFTEYKPLNGANSFVRLTIQLVHLDQQESMQSCCERWPLVSDGTFQSQWEWSLPGWQQLIPQSTAGYKLMWWEWKLCESCCKPLPTHVQQKLTSVIMKSS